MSNVCKVKLIYLPLLKKAKAYEMAEVGRASKWYPLILEQKTVMQIVTDSFPVFLKEKMTALLGYY